MKKLGTILIVLSGFAAQSAMADLFGPANGRSANLDNLADMSVEGGALIGGDYTTFGARFNYKLNPDMMLFGDIAQTNVDGFGEDASGIAFGGGLYYYLRNVVLLENTSTAVKGSYHLAPLDISGTDVDYSEIAIEALISGDQLATTDFGWYANAGLHIVSVEIDLGAFGSADGSDTELGFGGGIIGQASVGEWYAGVDFIDGLQLVGGFRYNL